MGNDKVENFEVGNVIHIDKNNVDEYAHIIGTTMAELIKTNDAIESSNFIVTSVDEDILTVTIGIKKK